MKKITAFILPGIVCVLAGCAGTAARMPVAPHDTGRAQYEVGDSREKCLQSIQRARQDARARTYRMYVFGRDRYDERFARFLGEFMITRYGIELIVCEPGDRDRDICYGNEMDKIIFTAFGPDILARAEQEARELFDAGR